MSETPEEVGARIVEPRDPEAARILAEEIKKMSETPEALADRLVLSRFRDKERRSSLRRWLQPIVDRWKAAEERARKAEEERDEARAQRSALFQSVELHRARSADMQRELAEERRRSHEGAQHVLSEYAKYRGEIACLLAEVERLERIIAAVPIDADERGQAVNCSACGLRKKPVGRDAPLALANWLCDDDCPGYREAPAPGDLWPGERRIDFGFPRWITAIAAEQERMRARGEGA